MSIMQTELFLSRLGALAKKSPLSKSVKSKLRWSFMCFGVIENFITRDQTNGEIEDIILFKPFCIGQQLILWYC